jgi:hypothetical protein
MQRPGLPHFEKKKLGTFFRQVTAHGVYQEGKVLNPEVGAQRSADTGALSISLLKKWQAWPFDHLYKNVLHAPPARSNRDCLTPCEKHPTDKMLNWFDAHVLIQMWFLLLISIFQIFNQSCSQRQGMFRDVPSGFQISQHGIWLIWDRVAPEAI